MLKSIVIFLTLISSIQLQEIKVIKRIDETVEAKPRLLTQNRVSDKVIRELFRNVSLSLDTTNAHNDIHKLSSIAIGVARSIRDYSNEKDAKPYEQYQAPAEFCPFAEKPKCDEKYSYRTYDGSCNNLQNSWWGTCNSPYGRLLEPEYNDGLNEPRKRGKSGKMLMNAREIAIYMHGAKNSYSTRYSNLVVHHGQLVSHDVSFIQSIADAGDEPIKCFCYIENSNCLKIDIPKDDEWNEDQTCMTIPRSGASFKKFNCDLGAREQYNSRTHWLDQSQNYGHNISLSSNSRTFSGGLLKSATFEGKKLKYLPYDKEGDCSDIGKGMNCFKAADKRVNQNLILVSLQTLWMRVHNGIAMELAIINPKWDDEKLFQEARRVMIAIYQHITYDEWMPLVVGKKVHALYELMPVKQGYSYNYNPKLYANLVNEFVAACFRFGHSMVRSDFTNVDSYFKEHGKMEINEIVVNTTYAFRKESGLDTFIRSCVYDGANKYDTYINDHLTNHLFENPRAIRNKRISLSAVNIARGRDHGLRPYLDYRELCGLNRAQNFDDLYNIPKDVRKKLKKIYEKVEDIDLFTGGLAERPIDGGIVGATFACIIAKQFKDLRVGDRHFYEHGNDENIRFTLDQLNEIKKTTMTDILCAYADVKRVQMNSFLLYDRHSNPYVKCDNKKISFNYTFWKDYSQYE